MAGNEALEAATRDVHRKIYLAPATSAHRPDRARLAYDEHMAVLGALQGREPERAKALMQSHLQLSAAHTLKVFKPPQPGEATTE